MTAVYPPQTATLVQALTVILTVSDGMKNRTPEQAAAKAGMEDGAEDQEAFVAAI